MTGGRQRVQAERSDAGRRLRGVTGAAVVGGAAVLALGVAVFGPVGSVSLLNGPLLTIVVELAALGLWLGVAGRPRRWWLTWGLGVAVGAAAAETSLYWWIRDSGLVNQHYPPSFLVWVWGALVAVGVALTGWWNGPAAVRAVRVVTAPLAFFAAFLLMNTHYGYWPTMGALLNRPAAGQVSGAALSQAIRGGVQAGAIGSVGTYGKVMIPGPPGFDAAPAWVWIPPAFNRVSHADLPVLVLLPGYPGTPNDWEQAGEVVALANSWARTHGGVAPVMILLNENGANNRDSECVNGPQGNALTYLTRSVPQYIVHHLGITPDPARWGVVGFSEGGTCALGLATERPHIYGRFVDIAGDMAPNYGHNTLVDLYRGNLAAQLAHEPRWLLHRFRYPHTEGWFAGSGGDVSHVLIARQLYDAAAAAGMKVFDVSGGAGGHSWTYARVTLRAVYPALVASMPTPPPPSGLPTGHHRVLVADARNEPADRHGST